MRRMVAALVAAVLAVGLLAQAAGAAELEWCAEDPVITVDGTVLRITTMMQTNAANVSGIAYEISVPRGSAVTVDSSDQTVPATVAVVYGPGDDVRASVTVSAATDFAVRVSVVGSRHPITRSGVSNRTIRFGIDMPHGGSH